ncbi:MAG: type II secretion system F family protein, partial [Legionella longbeachae]|nr:type II secretion system F family protein [Legionella longbeachae]
MKTQTNTTLTFHYKGINKSGQKMEGDIEARSIALAKVDLRRQGIIVGKITKKRA